MRRRRGRKGWTAPAGIDPVGLPSQGSASGSAPPHGANPGRGAARPVAVTERGVDAADAQTSGMSLELPPMSIQGALRLITSNRLRQATISMKFFIDISDGGGP
jgi:hypothetical protein